jgi:hypothetical protein
LEQIFQRLADGQFAKYEHRRIFLTSPQQFVSKMLQTNILIVVLKDLMRVPDSNVREAHSGSYDAAQENSEFMDMPLMESSSDESDSWTDSDDETNSHDKAKALVVNPFNTQKYRNAPEERKDGWKKVKAAVDTGASHFITADPSMLTNQRTSKTMISTAASGGTLQAKSRGTVNMEFDNQARTPFLKTTNAIYSPNCGEETPIPARQVCHNGDLIGIIYNNKMIEWHRKQNVRVTSKPLGTAWLDGQKDLYVQEVWVKQNDSEPVILIARVF